MAFNFKEKIEQAKQLLAVAPILAEGLKEQAKQKFGELSDSAHEKVETGRAVVEQVRAVAPIVIAIKKAEYQEKLGKLSERFGLSAAKPAQEQSPDAELEALLKSLGADAPAEAAAEEEHEAPAAAEPAAAAPANDAAPKAKKSGGKKKKAASTRKPK